jgi:hypothetical protein
MRAVTIKELNQELSFRTPNELRELCLRLAKFRKENKEFLTYHLFESSDEATYIEGIKSDVDQQFEQINRKNYRLIKKSLRKILTGIRKYIRYSRKKETEIDLLIYFCKKLKKFSPSIENDSRLMKLYTTNLETITKKMELLHEDLRFDYGVEMNSLKTGSNLPQ